MLTLPFIEYLERQTEFDTVIDTRSPSEFLDDHLPGAASVPVLSDLERAEVGTLYKASPFEARRLGAVLVGRNISNALEEQFGSMPKSWRPLVYCWRGGERSSAMSHVLSRVGWRVTQLEGGYKSYRAKVISDLAELSHRVRFRVLCGPTGSAKSRVLAALKQSSAQTLDLETIANHRGSLLGREPEAPLQPSQRRFESMLWESLAQFDPSRVVYIESESRKIGDLHLPPALADAMHASPCVNLSLDFDARVASLLSDYAHLIAEPDILVTQLGHLTSQHGKKKVAEWNALIAAADWRALVEDLLLSHYDAAYKKSTLFNFRRHEKAPWITVAAMDDRALHDAARAVLLSEDETDLRESATG